MEYVIGISCFLFGFVTHRMLNFIFNLGKSGLLVKAIGCQSLYLLSTTAATFVVIKQIRRKTLIESGADGQALTNTEQLYDAAYNNWKHSAIQNFLHSYPELFRNQLGFDDWDGAMRYLRKEYKNVKI